MQCFKLVNGGSVDRVIVFDSLPERFMVNVKTREAAGFPRAWAKWLAKIGSLRQVLRTETHMDAARNPIYTYTPIGMEPCFFILDYTDLNADKQRWREISEHVRTHTGPDVRLREKLEDMSLQLAANSTSELTLEPEDIFDPEEGKGSGYIPLLKEIPQEASDDDLIKPNEQIVVPVQEVKRRGRPKKVAVEA